MGPIDDRIRAVWADMIDTMEAVPGVGLAAPEIIWASAETRGHEEASPNLPGVSAKLNRPAEVRVRFTGIDGRRIECQFEGLWSTSVQHQIDHLDGKLFIDRLSRTRRDVLLRRLRKVAET